MDNQNPDHGKGIMMPPPAPPKQKPPLFRGKAKSPLPHPGQRPGTHADPYC